MLDWTCSGKSELNTDRPVAASPSPNCWGDPGYTAKLQRKLTHCDLWSMAGVLECLQTGQLLETYENIRMVHECLRPFAGADLWRRAVHEQCSYAASSSV